MLSSKKNEILRNMEVAAAHVEHKMPWSGRLRKPLRRKKPEIKEPDLLHPYRPQILSIIQEVLSHVRTAKLHIETWCELYSFPPQSLLETYYLSMLDEWQSEITQLFYATRLMEREEIESTEKKMERIKEEVENILEGMKKVVTYLSERISLLCGEFLKDLQYLAFEEPIDISSGDMQTLEEILFPESLNEKNTSFSGEGSFSRIGEVEIGPKGEIRHLGQSQSSPPNFQVCTFRFAANSQGQICILSYGKEGEKEARTGREQYLLRMVREHNMFLIGNISKKPHSSEFFAWMKNLGTKVRTLIQKISPTGLFGIEVKE